MKIILFGGSGQLGKEVIAKAASLNFELISPVTKEVNITDTEETQFLINKFDPDVIINCAAYTAVDLAESAQEQAMAINHHGVRNLAELVSARPQTRLIHISTDYVFAGDQQKPYTESDKTAPANVYGASKLLGEAALTELIPKQALILRTASLHGQYGPNFVHTMLRLFKERKLVEVVADQSISVTWAGWLADTILDLVRMDTTGLFHAAGAGATSWYEFAAEILRLVRLEGIDLNPDLQLNKTTTEKFVTSAKRPRFSVLDCSKLRRETGVKQLDWQAGLAAHLSQIDFGKNI